MLPQYIVSPKIVPVNYNNHVANIAIRLGAGVTVETTLESVQVSPSGKAPVWTAAPAAVGGYIIIQHPISALRFIGAGEATMLQQGI